MHDPHRRGISRRSGILAGLLATLGLVVGVAVPATAAGSNYVALGDSYTSGQGAAPYSDTVCFRSPAGYPAHVDAHLGSAEISRNLACSGADTGALIGQVNGDNAAVGVGWVTLTVGGIDAGSNSVATACPNGTLTTTCRALLTIDPTEEGVLKGKLRAAYQKVLDKYQGASIAVLGYPRLFGGIYLLASFPRAMNSASDTLNRIISEVVAEKNAVDKRIRFVDVRPAFRGHEIGTFSPWINYGVNPDADYHPTAAGYRYGYYQSLVNVGALPPRA